MQVPFEMLHLFFVLVLLVGLRTSVPVEPQRSKREEEEEEEKEVGVGGLNLGLAVSVLRQPALLFFPEALGSLG
ncbi:hypothetical protein OPV22_034526 [Ensete ventricosum]|uniref:Secreted protein n=1 Tax=Ensete ventricosum TaxID=4639 RepID=A0AAV8PUT9_ENSVE|nr:hypothetical protein OPV22_034526 [Ensete ventricosum]